MTAKSKKVPSPDELLSEVLGKEPARSYAFEAYLEAVHELQKKNYSYAKIADFLSERLGMKINRGQVYRAYQNWVEDRDTQSEERDEAWPPEEQDLDPVYDGAGELREMAKVWAEKNGYPADFGEQAICCAAEQIRREAQERQADERAADEADKGKEQANGSTPQHTSASDVR